MFPKPTSKYILRTLTSSIILLSATLPIAAKKKSNFSISKDTINLFRGVAVSADLFGAGQLLLSDYGQYEGAFKINLKDKYFPIVEIGYGKADARDDLTNIHYYTKAPYGKIGMDFNIMRNKHDIYRLYAGFRYAYTSFKYDVDRPTTLDAIWHTPVAYNFKNIDCNYHWLEGVFSVDAKIWGPIRLGWSVRYRRRIMHDDGPLGGTWYVPGYGRSGISRFGGTFNFTIEFGKN